MVPGFARYRSHKVVEAAEIFAAEFEEDGGGAVAIRPTSGPNIIPVPPGFQRKPGDLLAAMQSGGAVLVRYQPDGYLSWSPMRAFLDGYTLEPEDWRDRVRQERDQLAEKLVKLRQFLASDPRADDLMHAQGYAMGKYLAILNERILAFDA